jgi:hypothetical protein
MSGSNRRKRRNMKVDWHYHALSNLIHLVARLCLPNRTITYSYADVMRVIERNLQ